MIKALSAALLIPLIAFLHDFHVSITYAELNPASGNLEITMKVFTDDLEAAISDEIGESFRITSSGRSERMDSLIFSHIFRSFSLVADGQNLNIRPVGWELEQDIVFIYMQVEQMAEPKKLMVRNTLFFDRFDDQSNIVNVEVNDRLQSVFLEKGAPRKSLSFH